MDCLKMLKMGCREGERRKRITLRIIEFSPDSPSVKVEERKKYRFDGKILGN